MEYLRNTSVHGHERRTTLTNKIQLHKFVSTNSPSYETGCNIVAVTGSLNLLCRIL